MTTTPGATEMLPRPVVGRTFTASRRVRLSDTTTAGELRLDALARFVQDVASDDARETMADDYLAWVVRRTVFEVHRAPISEEMCELTTWCSGYGGRWAERRTQLIGAQGGRCESVVLWVAIDVETGAPARLPDSFHGHYDEACAGRRVSARLQHAEPPTSTESSEWRFRAADMDRLGHVNNAAYWVVAEELLGLEPRPSALRTELEYRDPLEADVAVTVRSSNDRDRLALWLTHSDTVHASMTIKPAQERP